MRAAASAVLGLAVLSGCHGARVQVEPVDRPSPYPAWFLNMPDSGEPGLAVGYARLYRRTRSSFAEAARDARLGWARGVGLTIDGARAFQSGPSGTASRGGFADETVSPEGIAAAERTVVLDSAVVNNMVIVLVGEPGSAGAGAGVGEGARPTWVETPPDDPDALYAVGVAPRYFYESSSWSEAERYARIQLAYSALTRFQTLHLQTGTSESRTTVSRTTAHLEGLRILERYRDPVNGFVYVLARCRMPDTGR